MERRDRRRDFVICVLDRPFPNYYKSGIIFRKHSVKKCIKELKEHLSRQEIVPLCIRAAVTFNNHFGPFRVYYGLKKDEWYCFSYHDQAQDAYSYFQQMIDFIIDEICKDMEHIIDHLSETKKKLTPGAKDSKCLHTYSHSGTQL